MKKEGLAGRTFKSESKSKSIAFKSKSKSSKTGLKSGLESKSGLEYYKSANFTPNVNLTSLQIILAHCHDGQIPGYDNNRYRLQTCHSTVGAKALKQRKLKP